MSLKYGYKAEDIVQENRISWEEIEAIKEWNNTVNVPKLIDEQVVAFILSCERDIEFTKKTILEYYKVRTYAKELFNDRDIQTEEMQGQLAILDFVELPVRTSEGYLIVYHKLYDTTYWKYHMDVAMRILFMTLDAGVHKYPPTGLIVLFDMQGLGLMHLTRVKMNNIKAFMHYCQDGLPVKLIGIHVLNSVYFLNKVMAIIKPFMKKELYELLHFHPASLNMEKFYSTYIEKSCLPSDYGGDLPNIRTLHEVNTKNLAELKCFFDAEEEQRKFVLSK